MAQNEKDLRGQLQKVMQEMEQHFIGHPKVMKQVLGAFLSGGHVLIEDIPGVGKTTLVKTVARYLETNFQRVQFTPDILPSDLIGVSIYHQGEQSFQFKKGPIFTQLLMADEINRASPKTQSSLLEAMEEKQVTIDGHTYPLSDLFMVIATQNPIEFEGTFPLPEAQMDRFMIQVSLGYPTKEQEVAIYKKETHILPLKTDIFLSEEVVKNLKKAIELVNVSDLIYDYVQRLVEKSRKHESLYYGLSPRAGIAMVKMAKFEAFMEERTYVIPEDIKAVAPCVMKHRLILKPEALYKEQTAERTIEEILNWVIVPKGSFDHGL